MKNIISNFIYLKGTSIDKYNKDLVKAEDVCERLPDATKFIVRKVMNDLLRRIVEKNTEDKIINFEQLISRTQDIIPENIYEYINLIRINTDNRENIALDKSMIRNHVQLLGLIHVLLVWYLKNVTNEIGKSRVISFDGPKTIATKREALNKEKAELYNIDIKINELRNEIINCENDFNKINDIRKEIEDLKINRKYIEPKYKELKDNINEHEENLLDIDDYYEKAKKKIYEIDNDMTEAYESLINKERMLINVEQENREFKNIASQLEHKSEQVDWNKQYTNFDLRSIREIYKKISNLTEEYQKILEEIKFSYNKSQEKILEKHRTDLRLELNFQNKMFNEKIDIYIRNVNEIKSKTMMLKEMFYDTTLNNSVHREFARSFLNLEGMQLRVFYSVISKVNNVSILINKSKEIISKSNDDAFMTYIRENAKELEKYNDEEVRLKLYYRLMELSRLPYRDFEDRFELIKTLDEIVDKAYDILKVKKDFKPGYSKIESIKSYYLSKFEQKNDNSEVITEKNLLSFVYNWRFVFNQNREDELIPLFVMQCIVTDRKSYEREYNMENHDKLIELWRRIQSKYSSILLNKTNLEKQLVLLIKDKKEIEGKLNGLTNAKAKIGKEYEKYEAEFKNHVLNSEKVRILPSYQKYILSLNKKKDYEEAISETKNKLGTIKSVLSIDMWKNQSEKIINNSNVSTIEKQLVEEAKDSLEFRDDYKNFFEKLDKIDDLTEFISEQKELLKRKNESIEESKNKIKELQKQLKIIKEEYPNIKDVIYY